MDAAVIETSRSEGASLEKADTRNRAIDVLRGAVMVLMVLDHARDFFFGFRIDPTDLEETTPVLFATRFVTHFCAPGFVLLAGVAAYLHGRLRPASELRRFLLTRGLWLVLLEVTVVRFGWVPEPFYRFTLLQVIWAIGWSMVLLAPLSSLPPRALALLGAAILVSHNLLDPIDAGTLPEPLGFAWAVLHDPSTYEPLEGHTIRVGYSVLPWFGVMTLGFGLGAMFTRNREERTRVTLALGLALIAAFFVVRGLNGYGDPEPWAVQRDAVTTVMSFFNCEKYPPSLAYLLVTLGPLLVALSMLERKMLPEVIARPLDVFGRVPLFFYVAHLYLLRFTAIGLALARWGWSAIGMPPEGHAGSPEYPLWATYVAWIVALALLLPACRWYADLKRRRARDWWWLRYL